MLLNLEKIFNYFYCGFIGKKAQTLSTHMRGCAEYNATLKKQKPENNKICIKTEKKRKEKNLQYLEIRIKIKYLFIL